MAVTETTNHGLKKQDKGDEDWHLPLNQTLDLLDKDIIIKGEKSVRPSAGTEDRMFYATNENRLYYDNGSSWDLVTSETTPKDVESSETRNVNDRESLVIAGDRKVDGTMKVNGEVKIV